MSCSSYENDNQSEDDFHRGKRHPTPVVSLGKILGYKLAGMDVVNKTVDLFNDVCKKLRRQDLPSSYTEAAGPSNVQTTIINVIQQKSSSDSDVHNDDKLYNRNINAMQRGQSWTSVYSFNDGTPGEAPSTQDTNVNATLRQELARQRLSSVKNARHKTTKAPIIRRLRSTPNTPRLRVNIAKQYPCLVEISEKLKSISKKREVTSNKTPHKQTSDQSKPNESVPSTSQKSKGVKNGSHSRSTAQKTKSGLDLDAKSPSRQSKEQKLLEKKNKQVEDHHNELLKSVEKEWPQLKKLLEDNSRSVRGQDETSKKGLFTRKPSEKTHVERNDKKRRYAEVASSRSKNGSDKEHGKKYNFGREDNSPTKISHKNKEKDTSVGGSFSSKKEAAKVDNSNPISKRKVVPKTWASVAKGTTNTDVTQGSHTSKLESPLAGVSGGGAKSLFDFPSLEELKGKRQIKDKCRTERLQALTMKQSGKSHASEMYEQFYRGDDSPARNKSKRQQKKGRNRKSKLRAKLTNKKDNAEEPKISQRTTSKQSCSTDSWYIDNMQEVVIQPVGTAVPLHQMNNVRAKEPSRTDGPVSFSFATTSSLNKNKTSVSTTQLRFDLCNELDAMSVASSSDTVTSFNVKCKRKKATESSSPAAQKNSRTRSQKDGSKSKREDRGASPKKISTRYRALLRRDQGKIDAKTATEMFNRDRLIDNHQKNKKFERFDHQQQRRKQTKVIVPDRNTYGRSMDDAEEGTSDSAHLNHNKQYYFLPQNNNCPTM